MSKTELPSVEISVDVAVGVDHVWQSLVTEGGLGPWMGDGASIEPQAGGKLRFPDVASGRERHGRVREVEEGQRLHFVWWAADDPTLRSEVLITVAPIDSGSRVTVVESITPPASRGFATASTARAAVPRETPCSGSVVGAWSWRLALLTLASQMVRV